VKISTPDLALLLGYMVGVVLFGVWMGRRSKGLSDYLVGGRDVPWWVVLFSIVATETSTVTFLSIPGFAYAADLTWLQLPLGYIVGRTLVVALLLPQYFRGQLFTAYQVLHDRFGGATERVASGLFLITRNLADGLRLFLTAIVLEQVAGIDLSLAVVCIGLATILYTVVGGMRAVVWTDMIQFLVYMAGALLALSLLVDHAGGWGAFVDTARGADKLRVFDFRFDLTEPYVFWGGLFGGAFLTLGTHGADQMMVQRYLCARSPRQASWALFLSGPVVLLQIAVFLLIGTGLWAFYESHPPAQEFTRADRVFATFIVEEIPPGLLGILLGAVFSAAMSTLSSSLNSSAAAAVKDLYLPLQRNEPTAEHTMRVTRWLTVLFGVVQIGVGIAGQWTQDQVVNNVLAIAGFTTGIILGVFFLGVFTRRVGQRAALTAMVLGLCGMSALKFGSDLAWPWFAMVGSLGTFALGVAGSYLYGEGR